MPDAVGEGGEPGVPGEPDELEAPGCVPDAVGDPVPAPVPDEPGEVPSGTDSIFPEHPTPTATTSAQAANEACFAFIESLLPSTRLSASRGTTTPKRVKEIGARRANSSCAQNPPGELALGLTQGGPPAATNVASGSSPTALR